MSEPFSDAPEPGPQDAAAGADRPSLGGVERPGPDRLGNSPLPVAPPPVSRGGYALAVGLSVLWIGVGVFLWHGTAPVGVLAQGLAMASVIVPVAMIWVLAVSLDQVRLLRLERERLQMVMDQMRLQAANAPAPRATSSGAVALAPGLQAAGVQASGVQATGVQAAQGPVAQPLPDDSPRLTFQSRREGSAPPPPRMEDQPGLALDAPEDSGAPLAMADFLRAVHFPDSPDDAPAFAALKLALADRLTSKLIQAAQDVLNLLAEDGIYMDDLEPDRARPELWRKFAAGERGRAIAALGGVRDRSCLALTAARMREDEIFRDVAHHFLRSFDKAFVAVEPKASDAQLSALSDTRTARAFMLFGRVTGTFD